MRFRTQRHVSFQHREKQRKTEKSREIINNEEKRGGYQHSPRVLTAVAAVVTIKPCALVRFESPKLHYRPSCALSKKSARGEVCAENRAKGMGQVSRLAG